jgi:hypothetical protein
MSGYFVPSAAAIGLTMARALHQGFPALTADKTLEYKFRALGILPLLFFLGQGIHYWRIHELGHLLWMCNIGNLLLAVGLFLDHRRLMRVAIIWTIPGLIIWLIYVVLAWGVFFTSTLAHVGGLVVGLFALRRIGMDRRSWLYAFVWYLLVQLASRLFTATDLNVNLAHKIQPGWDQRFGSYWEFWLVLTIATGCTLWLVEQLFRRIWPARIAQQEVTHA